MSEPEKKQSLLLATAQEREPLLQGLHPLFRTVDAGFHCFVGVLLLHPDWDDSELIAELCRRGVDPTLAEEVVVFAPVAFGRHIVEQLGIPCGDSYILHSLVDGTRQELPLAGEIAFAWAKQMIFLYRTSERNEVFKMIAARSAEFNAVNNALNQGTSMDELRRGRMVPCVVHLHRLGGNLGRRID